MMPIRQWIHILGAVRQTSGSETGLIWKSGSESRISFGWGEMPWKRFALSEDSLHSPRTVWLFVLAFSTFSVCRGTVHSSLILSYQEHETEHDQKPMCWLCRYRAMIMYRLSYLILSSSTMSRVSLRSSALFSSCQMTQVSYQK